MTSELAMITIPMTTKRETSGVRSGMQRWAVGRSSWMARKTIIPPTIAKTMPSTCVAGASR